MTDGTLTPLNLRGTPVVTFVIPVFNAVGSLERCVRSALRQTGIDRRLLLVDHGSQDGSRELALRLSRANANLEVICLARHADDRRTPAKPLNVGLWRALECSTDAGHSWVFRLDADDFLLTDEVVATQLAQGGYRTLIMAPLVFFDEEGRSAYEYGPWPSHRSLNALRRRGVYSVAHHANAMRQDLLVRLASGATSFYDESLDYGEDLDFTCVLLRIVDEDNFAFVRSPYCFKSLGSHTASDSLAIKRLWSSHLRLLQRNPELSTYAAMRGMTELVLGRLTGERPARRWLQRFAGHNGFYQEIAFSSVASRIRELETREAVADSASEL